MDDKRLHYMGKLLTELTKEELIEAVETLVWYNQCQRDLYQKQIELASLRYTPETFVSRLISVFHP